MHIASGSIVHTPALLAALPEPPSSLPASGAAAAWTRVLARAADPHEPGDLVQAADGVGADVAEYARAAVAMIPPADRDLLREHGLTVRLLPVARLDADKVGTTHIVQNPATGAWRPTRIEVAAHASLEDGRIEEVVLHEVGHAVAVLREQDRSEQAAHRYASSLLYDGDGDDAPLPPSLPKHDELLELSRNVSPVDRAFASLGLELLPPADRELLRSSGVRIGLLPAGDGTGAEVAVEIVRRDPPDGPARPLSAALPPHVVPGVALGETAVHQAGHAVALLRGDDPSEAAADRYVAALDTADPDSRPDPRGPDTEHPTPPPPTAGPPSTPAPSAPKAPASPNDMPLEGLSGLGGIAAALLGILALVL